MAEIYRNKDGIAYPSIDKLLAQIDSKYKLAYAAAKVAKIIDKEHLEVQGAISKTTLGKALEEIVDGRVKITFE